MNKLPDFDTYLATSSDFGFVVWCLQATKTAVDKSETIIQKSWEFVDRGSLEKNRKAFHKAVRQLENCYQLLFQSVCTLGAEAQTLYFLASLKNYVIKDFIRRPNTDGRNRPPLPDDDNLLDTLTRDGLLKAIESSFEFQAPIIEEKVSPILHIIRSGDYSEFDIYMDALAVELKTQLLNNEAEFLKFSGLTIDDAIEQMNNGIAMRPDGTIIRKDIGPQI